jgi:predicted phage terminase large subunit-like protein
MGALQYVDCPNYAAILFRKTFTDLSLAGGLLPRAAEWLSNTGARFSDVTKTWSFPSGATVSFGHMDTANTRFRYQSAEFQYVGFDEASQFSSVDVLYLHSRLRRRTDSPVPIRMRLASNPGGKGHAFLRKRFGIGKGRVTEPIVTEGRLYLPARLEDNEHLDAAEYELALANLDPYTRAQLRYGDWSDFEAGHFRPNKWPRYSRDGAGNLVFQPRRLVREADCLRFVICDPAATAGGGDHTAILVLAVTPTGDLLILDLFREQLDVAEIIPALADVCRKWQPTFAGIESVAFQRLLVRNADRYPGLPPIRELRPANRSKLQRAVEAIVKAERGQIFLPADEPPWLEQFCLELSAFSGVDDESDDAVDALAYGVHQAAMLRQTTAAVMSLEPLTPGRHPDQETFGPPRGRTGALGYGREGDIPPLTPGFGPEIW